ncbi:DUF7344 domain-containing protein [Salinilacihabitans rarus]|uniref:DUF7344 domain-containing protein n=1 Tax=Salinilacihabitans rarus TaxID=2961596 RepID=UPI0020C8841A|nr:hypothetical protein [Salinilacihabitans rarus]
MAKLDGESLGRETVHELLSDARRERLLAALLDAESESERATASATALARRVAAREREVAPDAVDDAALERVAVALVHHHLPRLDDHGIVDYDPQSHEVTPAENVDALEPFVGSLD